METTLVTSVTTSDRRYDNPGNTMRDVLTRISDHGPFRLINFEDKHRTIEVKVSEAERISLIEALGGKA